MVITGKPTEKRILGRKKWNLGDCVPLSRVPAYAPQQGTLHPVAAKNAQEKQPDTGQRHCAGGAARKSFELLL
ncbi:MAG: hypothetical protein LUG55_00355 [Clostridiales bacterium]|nr:hypothetical protein [Clostridiales bacterium]